MVNIIAGFEQMRSDVCATAERWILNFFVAKLCTNLLFDLLEFKEVFPVLVLLGVVLRRSLRLPNPSGHPLGIPRVLSDT